jgi:zinc transport system permease protein
VTPADLVGPLLSGLSAILPFSFAEPEFMRRALLAALLTAPATALVGVPLVHYRMAFFSDAVGHSAFTGIALGVLLGVSPLATMVLFGVAVAWSIVSVRGRTELSSDTVIGVFFSTVVALGIAILSARKGLARDLQGFLYGDLLSVGDGEILWMAAILVVVCAWMALCMNRLLMAGTHPGVAAAMGVRPRRLETALAVLAALVVTTAIRTVGILLVTALLVIPAATARNVARSARGAFGAALLVSLFSALGGTVASFYLDTATGATVVLFAAACFALSALVRAARG